VVATNRTSLIVDPPDGRVPPLTPHGKAREAALAAKATLPPVPKMRRFGTVASLASTPGHR
jgi:hypothetical protein